MSFDGAERKLAAIMVADMVGFARLLGIDEEGTLRRLADARAGVIDPAVAEHNGRIFKLIGDGILAEFPSAVLALRCAIVIQTRMHERAGTDEAPESLRFRIAVHQGEVVIDKGDLLGDGVNVAARLERLAEPGGICVSGRVHEDAAGKIPLDIEDMGEHTLRNIARSVRVLRVRMPWMQVAGEDTDADSTFIRFVPPVCHKLRVIGGGEPAREVPVGPGPLTIGRSPPCVLILHDREVSRQHCRIDVKEGGAWLTDLDSSNGTFLAGMRIDAPARLDQGATIRLGNHTLVYEWSEAGLAESDGADLDARPPGPCGPPP